MGNMLQNLRYAMRILSKSPGFTLVVVLTLALGIGANTAIFSVVYAALLRPLPYGDPTQLLFLGENRSQLETNIVATQVSYPDFQDWKKRAKTIQSFAGFSGDAFTIEAGGEPKNTFAAQVTPNFFSTLGVRPVLGRDFLDGEDQGDGPHVAILSDGFWRSEFGADRSVIGRAIHLDGKPATIVGVLPQNFEFAPANSAPLWVPVHQTGDPITRRSLRWFSVFGRIAPGYSPEQVRAEMVAINAQLSAEYPKENRSIFFVMRTFPERITGRIRPLLFVLLGAVGFVLLITCANVANLLLTRSIGRRREFAVRAALGASPGNLLFQLLTESVLLSALGAFVGLLIAHWGVSSLVAAIPERQLLSMPYLREAGINLPVLAFLCAVTLVTGILFGLAPGFHAARSPLNETLKDESRGGTSTAHARLRNSLVVAEISISLVLLVGAGLVLESLRALLRHDPGFDATNALTFDVNLPDLTYPSEKTPPYNSPSALRFDRVFTEKLRRLPGIVDVAQASGIPASGGSGSIRFLVEGRPKPIGQEDESNILTVSSGYFSTLKIPLEAGRIFSEHDSLEGPLGLMVNRAFVKAYFPNEDPLGKRIRFTFSDKNPYREIIGVVGNTAEVDLAQAPPPIIFTPNEWAPNTYLRYMLRTSGDPVAFVGAARVALREMDPQLPMIQPRTLEQVAKESPAVFLRRYPAFLIGSFATLALILAMVGLYGLISYMVLQRTREIGIRIAMGAQRRDILKIVLQQGVRAAVAGVAIGILAGLALTRLMSSLLYGVAPSDAFTFSIVAILLLLVAIAASLLPARRAMRVDPIVALHYE